jgi:hypothetical protein
MLWQNPPGRPFSMANYPREKMEGDGRHAHAWGFEVRSWTEC